MKIAMFVPGGVDRSGEVRVIPVLLALIRRLAMTHELHVFALRQEPEPGNWPLLGATVHNLAVPRYLPGALRSIAVEHRARRFDVMHAMWGGVTGALAIAAGKLLGVPSLVHLTGGELVALGDIGYGGSLTLRGRMLQKFVLRCATRLTCTSEPVRVQISANGADAVRIPLGIDLDSWPPRQPRRRDVEAPLRLIHVASLNAVKDQPTLLRALRMLADRGVDFRIDIVGDDVRGGVIQKLALELGLESRVSFHDFLTQARLRPLVEAADIAVFSSRHEAGPAAMLEAAVMGVPSVGTDVGHISEWKDNAALAVPVADAAALADALERLLHDEEMRLRLARAARLLAEREDADHTALGFNEIYRQLSAARRSRT